MGDSVQKLNSEIQATPGSCATATHCPYCALQCGIELRGQPEKALLNGDVDFPVNKGALCIKGWTAGGVLNHPDRLTQPLVRRTKGFAAVTWEEALDRVAHGLRAAQSRYGMDAAGLFGSGALTNEKTYLLGKLARVGLRTASIDYNGRFCMSSAAAAGNRAFGIDRGLPFPVADIARAETILLVGSNVAETMPPIMQYFEEQRRNGGRLIVVDPRTSPTSEAATLHLRLTPRSDAALANGLLHILVRDNLIDEEYIGERTEGFDAAKSAVAAYWPAHVERITGVSEARLLEAAHLLGFARSAMILTGRGPEQQSQGVNNTLSFINIAFALGMVGRPFSGYGCLTGQGNGQGGREHGQKADQLPGYRRIDDPAAREHMAAHWGVPESSLPGAGKPAYQMLESLGREGGVRALMVVGSNIAVASPAAGRIRERLKELDFLTVSDFFLTETAELADVVLPVAQWAEEEGTMTNLEGRVILRHRAFPPPAGVRTDIEVICELGRRLGKGEHFAFENTEEIFDELRAATAGGPADYSGITYEKIEANKGVFWPCPTRDHPGTPRLFAESFPTPSGRARFVAVRHQPPAEEPDDYRPLYLTTGRLLAHYQSGSQTRRVARLSQLAPEPYVEMNPVVARRNGIGAGDRVWIETRRDAAVFKVRVNAGIREDTLFLPFHWGGRLAANRLTNPALDPVSSMPEFKVCAARISIVKDE